MVDDVLVLDQLLVLSSVLVLLVGLPFGLGFAVPVVHAQGGEELGLLFFGNETVAV